MLLYLFRIYGELQIKRRTLKLHTQRPRYSAEKLFPKKFKIGNFENLLLRTYGGNWSFKAAKTTTDTMG